jgi:cobaltochelatase CobT
VTPPQYIKDVVGLGLATSFVVLLFFWFRRRSSAGYRRGPVPDEPEGTPYHVYAREFDRTVAARDAPALLAHADPGSRSAEPPAIAGWSARLAAAAHDGGDWAFAPAGALLEPLLNGEPIAVSLLIDQSGSMRDHIVEVAPVVRWLADLFQDRGVPLEATGFTTLGWRGGAVRRKWIANGRPAYPGRLCALLDVRYKDFDGPLAEEDWRVMLHPGVLRENIDGEAILNAVERLHGRHEPRKLLVVLSDGAPVDDSTLMENGPTFLERHVRSVIAGVECRRDIALGAIGIGYAVDRYYGHSRQVADLAELPLALAQEMADLAALILPSERNSA